MRLDARRRIARLEATLNAGPDADGACAHCRGRTDLGRVVVFDQVEDGPRTLRPRRDGTPVPPAPPTPCPRCGRNTNVHVIIRRSRHWQGAA